MISALGTIPAQRFLHRSVFMARYQIPPNTGKVKVAMGLGGTYVVWNGKQGKHEFSISCRKRKQAEQVARIINEKRHNGEIEVLDG